MRFIYSFVSASRCVLRQETRSPLLRWYLYAQEESFQPAIQFLQNKCLDIASGLCSVKVNMTILPILALAPRGIIKRVTLVDAIPCPP